MVYGCLPSSSLSGKVFEVPVGRGEGGRVALDNLRVSLRTLFLCPGLVGGHEEGQWTIQGEEDPSTGTRVSRWEWDGTNIVSLDVKGLREPVTEGPSEPVTGRDDFLTSHHISKG